MRSSSDRYPDSVVLSNDRTQIRYNIMPSTVRDMDGSIRTTYQFDYVEITGEVTKEKIVEAILLDENPEPVIDTPKEIAVKPVIDVEAVRIMATEAIAEVAKRAVEPEKRVSEIEAK